MFRKPAISDIYTCAQNNVSPVTPPYQVDEKKTARDETTFRQGDVLETRRDTVANGSARASWTSSASGEIRHSSEPVILKSSQKLWRNKFSRRNWKPITLQHHVLLSFIVTSLSLIAILEVLYYFSKGENGGGLAFAPTVEQLPTQASFSYLYLPTVLAVLYSILWSWIDLDVKRLEPWFQLSKSDGATAEDSLLLHYPFEFLAFVPIRALRRRHWAVFYAGLVTMLIFWAITPLQSAIFNIGTVSRTRHSQMITAGTLLPMNSQTTALNANFMNTAYGVAWLGQKLPEYTTEDYALKPFAPLDNHSNVSFTETWGTSTVAYGTNLTCYPAHVSFNNATTGYTFDNGAGCTTQELYFPKSTDNSETLIVQYIQYWDNAEADWALQGPNCSTDHSHNFLALAANRAPEDPQLQGGVYPNLTALFCQPDYFRVEVIAVVNGTDKSIVSSNFSVTSSNTKDLPENFFNVTNFEYIIGTGISPITTRQDYQNTVVLQQYPRVFKYHLIFPVSNMVGFAIARHVASNSSVQSLTDASVLQNAFEKAHRLLFATAISTLTEFVADNGSREIWDGLIYGTPAAITFTREFAIVVEISLALVASLTCALWYHSHHRPSKLSSDPAASIADVMALVSNSKDLSQLFQDDGTVTEETLKHRLRKKRFLLRASNIGQGMRLNVHDTDFAAQTNPQNRKIQDKSPNKLLKMVRPAEMTLGAGAGLITLILGSICLLTVFYMRVTEDNGLRRPSTNILLLSFLENALPTAFASILEPLWIVLNRLLCVLRPFEDLRIGNAYSSSTIRVQYTSLPPQLVFLRALKSRHFILTAVCAVALSSNILAVSLGGLFNEGPTSAVTTMVLPRILASAFNEKSAIGEGNTNTPNAYLDHFYVTLSNITDSTPLPPWIDYDMFYLPFEMPTVPDQLASASSQEGLQVKTLTGPTRGFGVVANCSPGGVGMSNTTVTFDLIDSGSNGSEIMISVSQNGLDGSNTMLDQRALNLDSIPDTASANEVAVVLANSTMFVLGWARIGPILPNTSSTANNTMNGRSFDYTSMFCSPQLVTAEYDVVVDPSGHIISTNQLTSFEQNTTIYSSARETSLLLVQFNELLALKTSFIWHNDSFASDWINTILKAYMNSTDFIDANKPLTDINSMVPIVEKIYQRLCAVILGVTPNVFLPALSTDRINASVSTTEIRIFMSPLMFEITIVLLSLHLLTAGIYYVRRPKRFLPRMPTTIANLFAYVSMSHTLEDVPSIPGNRRHDARYGYGRFIGVDGKPHVGIERSSRVVPLQNVNPAVRRRGWNVGAWLRHRDDQENWI